MKLWKKIKSQSGDKFVRKYKLFGMTVLRKEKSPIKKKIKVFGIQVYHKKQKSYQKKEKKKPVVFPKQAVSFAYQANNKLKKHGRVAIFASFSDNGKIADYVVYYLTELKRVCDNIIFIADNPIIPTEVEKIKDLVIYAQFKRHKEYDFGSYKRGYLYAQTNGLLKNCDELVICNDSCYGPIYPFSKVFDIMDKKSCDFWGLIQNDDMQYHLQSWFYVFKKNVIDSGYIGQFLNKIKKEKNFWKIVMKYEFTMTQFLMDKGFKVDAFLPLECPLLEKKATRAGHRNKTVSPLTLIRDYHFPMIKVKCFTNGYTYLLEESPQSVLTFLKEKNNTLYRYILSDLKDKKLTYHLEKTVEKLVDKAKVVSFDIFDTLLIRPYVKPTDLFLHMEQFYHVDGFHDERVNAELRARRNHPHLNDITLDEIYRQILPKFYSYKEKELEWEKRLLMPHPLNMEIYRQAVKKNKKIVIASDMYLPTDFLKEVLGKNGYTRIDKIYVSGDCNKTKCSGDMFRQIITDFNVEPVDILHIGDNEYSDVSVPRSVGLNTFYVKKYYDCFIQYGGNQKYINFYNNGQRLEKSIIVSQIARHQLMPESSSYWEEIGYTLGGPLAVGYIQKVIKECQLNQIDHLLFVARDGYLLQKIYNKIAKDPLPNTYIYAPRILSLTCFGDYGEQPHYLNSYISLLNKVFSEIPVSSDYEKNKKTLVKYDNLIQPWLKKNKKDYDDYIQTLNIHGKRIASVDMTTGAFTSERFLKKIFGSNYCMGFFSATFRNDVDLRYETYMEGLINPKQQESIFELSELLITSPEYPIVGIKNLKPVYKESAHDKYRTEVVRQIEKGVLKYLNDYLKTPVYPIQIKMDIVMDLYNNYINYLTPYDISSLKKVYHSADMTNENFISLYDSFQKRKSGK
ncbi:MAG: hypothetical protein J6Y03_02375 [Alphaproteobacteria bacterium]|nr:hypothetical protein [Alphaproteobacteria bacterium]